MLERRPLNLLPSLKEQVKLLETQPAVLPSKTQTLPHGQGETILVVEDNAAVREVLVASLELLNYRMVAAKNGQEALAIFDQYDGGISLVLSDLVMPEMGGKALALALKQRDPAVRVVVLSGHPLEHQIEELRTSGVVGCLQKPPSLEQLAKVVARALGTD